MYYISHLISHRISHWISHYISGFLTGFLTKLITELLTGLITRFLTLMFVSLDVAGWVQISEPPLFHLSHLDSVQIDHSLIGFLAVFYWISYWISQCISHFIPPLFHLDSAQIDHSLTCSWYSKKSAQKVDFVCDCQPSHGWIPKTPPGQWPKYLFSSPSNLTYLNDPSLKESFAE